MTESLFNELTSDAFPIKIVTQELTLRVLFCTDEKNDLQKKIFFVNLVIKKILDILKVSQNFSHL